MSLTAIHTENLTCDFGTVRAVDGLSLDVPTGTVFGFLGPNGAGKTTTIRLLLGLLEPTAGSAQIFSSDTIRDGGSIRERTGALLEHTGIYERLSAVDNLEFFGRINRIPRTERRERIRTLLTRFGLWDRRRDRAGTWSRGMKQKLAIARTLLHEPELVFLDEPTAGLDPIAAAAIRDELAKLAEDRGITVFLTTHNLAEAEKLCTLVGVINSGKLLTVGHPDELRSRAGGRVEIVGDGFTPSIITELERSEGVRRVEVLNGRLTLDLAEKTDTAPLVALLVHRGAAVREVRAGSTSLEDAFIELLNEEAGT
jgi:ABC-2 type transport system ATP-binding protein